MVFWGEGGINICHKVESSIKIVNKNVSSAVEINCTKDKLILWKLKLQKKNKKKTLNFKNSCPNLGTAPDFLTTLFYCECPTFIGNV